MNRELEFERPVRELERQIEALRNLSTPNALESAPASTTDEFKHQIDQLKARAADLEAEIFKNLSRWQRVQLARHPERPYTLDYIEHMLQDFVELHGDRAFGDDAAIIGGPARLGNRKIMLIGHQKGRTTQDKLRCNFGMPRPEGYRKALRLMKLAERFRLPVVTLIDTPGAYPGIDAEARGQAQAIAEALESMAGLRVPVVSAVIGEGGSGGALAIGVANRILMLEFAIYSVISPEGCASILFKDAAFAEQAADALKLTAPDLYGLGVVDALVPEPQGGAHRAPAQVALALKEAIEAALAELEGLAPDALADDRYAKFRALGAIERGR